MTRNSILLLSLVYLLALIGNLAQASCPKESKDWDTWIRDHFSQTRDLLGEDNEIGSTLRKEELDLALQCSREIPPFSTCVDPLISILLSSKLAQGDYENHEQGLTVSDKDYYLQASPYLGFEVLPKEVQSPEFLSAIRKVKIEDPKSFSDFMTLLEGVNKDLSPSQKWKFIAFKRTPITPPDLDSLGGILDRGLIHIPSDYLEWLDAQPKEPAPGKRKKRRLDTIPPRRPDVYIQFSIANDQTQLGVNATNPLNQYSVLAVTQPTSAERQKEYYLWDYQRTEANTLKQRASVGTCYECHVAGGIPISTDEKSVMAYFPATSTAKQVLSDINQSLRNNKSIHPYAPPPYRTFGNGLLSLKVIDEEYAASIAESETYESLDQAPEKAAPFLTPERKDLIQKAGRCNSCHDGAFRPVLGAWSESPGFYKLLIEKGLMPPRNTLTPIERETLYHALNRDSMERFEKEFFETNACTSKSVVLVPVPKS